MTSITSTRKEDSDLWAQVIEGSAAAFEIVVAKYQNAVSAVSYSRVGDFNISEDISQETFLIAWQSRDSLGEMGQPNDTQLKRWVGADRSQGRWLGKKYQSRSQLGRPWIDVQFSDLDFSRTQTKPEYLIARGWIAFGDRADGWLIAIGGIARGLIAGGGIAYGGIAFGGLSFGIVALGGLGLGLLAIGGLAIGGLALGGGAIGYDAVGGGALAWHCAAGGGAIAHHAAIGGGAMARDYAVGGAAVAREANTPQAKAYLDQQWVTSGLKWMERWAWLSYLAFPLGLLPALGMRLFYRKENLESTPP